MMRDVLLVFSVGFWLALIWSFGSCWCCMDDGFLGPWQTTVLAPRGGKIACVFDDPYDQFEWESGV